MALWPQTNDSPYKSSSISGSISGNHENRNATDEEGSGDKHVSTLVLFGGYYPDARLALNDLWCLDVKEQSRSDSSRTYSSSSSSSSSKCSINSSSGRSDLWQNSQEDGVHEGMEEVTSEIRGEAEDEEGGQYMYAWRRARVAGQVPEARLAHSATVIPPFRRALNSAAANDDGSSDAISTSSGPWMVVFGGVGIGAVFGDVCVLNCANAMVNAASISGSSSDAGNYHRSSSSIGTVADLEWENVQVQGTSPPPRYGHTASLLSAHRATVSSNISKGNYNSTNSAGSPGGSDLGGEACATLALFGGTTGGECYNDLWLLHCDMDAHVVTWSRPQLYNDPNHATLPAQALPAPSSPPRDEEQSEQHPEVQQSGGDESIRAEEERGTASSAAGCPALVPTSLSPRSRHQMVALFCPDDDDDNESSGDMAEIFLFGGSDDIVDRQAVDTGIVPPADNSVYILRTLKSSALTTTTMEGVTTTAGKSSTWKEHVNPNAATRHQIESKGDEQEQDKEEAGALPLAWHVVKSARVLAVESEPSLAWSPSTLLSDLASLVDEPVFADVSFAFEPPPLSPFSSDPYVLPVGVGAAEDHSAGDDDDERHACSTVELQNPLAAAAADSSAWLPSDSPGEAPFMPKHSKIYDEESSSLDSENDERSYSGASHLLQPPPPHVDAPPPSPPLLAHRVLLTLRDDPIAVMLKSSMREGRSGVINLSSDVERSAFSAVLAFLYTDALFFPSCHPACPEGGTTTGGNSKGQSSGDASGGLSTGKRRATGGQAPTPELVMSTLYLGQQYCLPRLVALCEGLLLRICDCSANAAALLDFAHLVGLPRLAAAVRSHAFRSTSNWAALKASDGWCALAPEVQEELCKARTHNKHLYEHDVPDHELKKQQKHNQDEDEKKHDQGGPTRFNRSRRRFDPTLSFRGIWARLSNSDD